MNHHCSGLQPPPDQNADVSDTCLATGRQPRPDGNSAARLPAIAGSTAGTVVPGVRGLRQKLICINKQQQQVLYLVPEK